MLISFPILADERQDRHYQNKEAYTKVYLRLLFWSLDDAIYKVLSHFCSLYSECIEYYFTKLLEPGS